MSDVRKRLRDELNRWIITQDDVRSEEWPTDDYNSDDLEEFEQKLQTWGCEFVGEHEPTVDQCLIPAHDLCAHCGLSMPGQAPRPDRSAEQQEGGAR